MRATTTIYRHICLWNKYCQLIMFDSCNVTLSKWINVTVLYRPKAHLHDMVSLISNWFILGPTERSLNSCSVIATQPTSLPYPIFIQVDYKWATWRYKNSPHDWNTWQYNHPNQLNPSLYEWTTSRYTYNFFMYTIKPIHVQLHCIYAKKNVDLKTRKNTFYAS